MMEVSSENIQFDPFCLVGDHHREDVHYIDNFNVIDQCGLMNIAHDHYWERRQKGTTL
jgi:hypothetical protein